jgi:alkylmercury lyase
LSTKPFITEIVDTLIDDGTGMNLMAAAIRLLAHGQPITVDQLARAAGLNAADIAAVPAADDIEYDGRGRIIGWGLTLNPTPHRYIVDDRLLYTWCAADTLLFPAIIGRAARIESPCPTTETTIRLTAEPRAGIVDLEPASAVLSMPGRGELDISHVRQTCCNPGRYFADMDAASNWRHQHPTGAVLSVADAYKQISSAVRRAMDPSRRGGGPVPCA